MAHGTRIGGWDVQCIKRFLQPSLSRQLDYVPASLRCSGALANRIEHLETLVWHGQRNRDCFATLEMPRTHRFLDEKLVRFISGMVSFCGMPTLPFAPAPGAAALQTFSWSSNDEAWSNSHRSWSGPLVFPSATACRACSLSLTLAFRSHHLPILPSV